MIHGHLSGLAPSQVKTLERIQRRRVPADHLVSPELVKSLAQSTMETGRQVGVLLHRSGTVDSVIVGDATGLLLPDVGRLRAAEGRFRALRLVHTHVRGEPLTRDDLVDLVRLRLDAVVALQMAPTGEVRSLEWAHNVVGSPPYRVLGPEPVLASRGGFLSLVQGLEAEFARETKARAVQAKDGRAILVHVFEKAPRRSSRQGRGGAEFVGRAEAESRQRELAELARTAGTDVADAVVQMRDAIDPRFVIGRGKLDDILIRAAELDVETLIFDRNLTPAQAAAIAAMSDLKVIDRTQLILDIFAQRAETKDGKLQVELAQLRYSLPRLGKRDDSLSRLTGGIGGRGPGETKLEIGRRRARERITRLEAELRNLSRKRAERRSWREKSEVPTVSIVGYTNAGKSTLLRTLSGADVTCEDKLFATLDTRSRRIRAGWAGYGEREVVLTDTVGFIRDLPPDLFAAFRATFEEAARADVLLHVVDASDPAFETHIDTTSALLDELSLAEHPTIMVFNKADRLEPGEGAHLLARYPGTVLVSALVRETTRALVGRIAETLGPRWTDAARPPESPDDTPDPPDVAPRAADAWPAFDTPSR